MPAINIQVSIHVNTNLKIRTRYMYAPALVEGKPQVVLEVFKKATEAKIKPKKSTVLVSVVEPSSCCMQSSS